MAALNFRHSDHEWHLWLDPDGAPQTGICIGSGHTRHDARAAAADMVVEVMEQIAHLDELRMDAELLARRFIEHAPPARRCPNPELLGWSGPDGMFICQQCAGRILDRGCNLKQVASDPVYDADPKPTHEPCCLCHPDK